MSSTRTFALTGTFCGTANEPAANKSPSILRWMPDAHLIMRSPNRLEAKGFPRDTNALTASAVFIPGGSAALTHPLSARAPAHPLSEEDQP